MKCRGHPTGMHSKEIPDENIVASSWQEPFHSFRPEAGRLDNEDGVWCPNTLGNPDKKHYVQIEFPSRYNVCAVATQGSPLHSTDWVKKYRLQFSLDGKNFTTYTENGTVRVQFAKSQVFSLVSWVTYRPTLWGPFRGLNQVRRRYRCSHPNWMQFRPSHQAGSWIRVPAPHHLHTGVSFIKILDYLYVSSFVRRLA